MKKILAAFVAAMMIVAMLGISSPASAKKDVYCSAPYDVVNTYRTNFGGDNKEYYLQSGYIYRYCSDTNGPDYVVPFKWVVAYQEIPGTGSKECLNGTASRFRSNIGAVGRQGQYNPGWKAVTCLGGDSKKGNTGNIEEKGVIFVNDDQNARCFGSVFGYIDVHGNTGDNFGSEGPACFTRL